MNANEEFNTLAEQWEQIDIFAEALKEMQVADNDFAAESISRALEKIASFEPTISVIGQVKAGKSTLLNAVIGRVLAIKTKLMKSVVKFTKCAR